MARVGAKPPPSATPKAPGRLPMGGAPPKGKGGAAIIIMVAPKGKPPPAAKGKAK